MHVRSKTWLQIAEEEEDEEEKGKEMSDRLGQFSEKASPESSASECT